MKFSEFVPSLIYINMPDDVLNPTTEEAAVLCRAFMTALDSLKIVSISYQQLLSAACIALSSSKLTMPYDETNVSEAPKTQRAAINEAREQFVAEILGAIDIEFSSSATRYLLNKRDITPEIRKDLQHRKIAHRQSWINGISIYLSRVLQRSELRRPIAVIATDPRRLVADKLNPIIGLVVPYSGNPTARTNQELRMKKRADEIVILSTDVGVLQEKLANIVSDFTELRERNEALRASLKVGNIKLEKQFTRDMWPGYILMTNVKKAVRPIVQEVIESSGILCDALDLEYQTLFRLTSLPVSLVFEDGEVLDEYLRAHNAYGYWRNILTLDPQKAAHPVKLSVVREIVEEQLLIIQDRLRNTTLPLNRLIQKQGIFTESNWKLQKHGGDITAIKVEQAGNGHKVIDSRTVTFKPVDVDYARELHSALHYIHTPRAIKAFGLYLGDDSIPFSVVAFDAIDRPYKKDLLLMYGYNPSKCLDLARLYSRPGTPFNTSSTIFTLAFSHFREHEPDIQAILSAFMPTYAHGMSMISAGFNYGVLVKEWRHSFAERDIDGRKAWELVTKRRKNNTQITIDSKWPLLPVFELMATLQPPRFMPFKELSGMMVSRDL